MLKGCHTALITPFDGDNVDYKGLDLLVNFQLANGIDGILAVGTTGESPTLTWQEHIKVIEVVAEHTRHKCRCIAGTGSNNTSETLEGTKHAAGAGVDAVLLVDPYYNGPSSLEIRREYVEPVARAFPGIEVVPYVIPGRTGAQLLPEDLALLNQRCENINTVKEATGDVENMKRTRTCCGPDFNILSGDDGMTYTIMTDPAVDAAGVISVLANVVPAAVVNMVRLLTDGQQDTAREMASALEPLFGLVTVKSSEATPYGEVVCRARNPLGVKTLMNILGMPAGGCRQPLGKMSRMGLDAVLAAARKTQAEHPEILAPIAEFFSVDIQERLENPVYLEGLCYDSYG